YPAEIRGGFSMIQIRTQNCTVYSMGSHVDYLVVFNQMAYDRTIKELKTGGTIIYDPDEVTVDENIDANMYPIPLTKIVTDLTGSKLGKNVVALGALGHLFDIDMKVLEKLIQDRYGSKGHEAIENNHKRKV
ncbi:2-oxoacid:acceptor oxidoreductase family protein, partial [Bacteroidota bacterium]